MSQLNGLSSDQLLAQLIDLVHRGRKLEADLIAHLAEVDERRLYLREGCPSMFAYCVDALRFAEAVAYKRIAAARAARRHPELLTALRNGALHLTAVSLLAPHLTAENSTQLLAAARHRTADEIRRMLADRQPKPDVASVVRRLSGSSVRGDSSVRNGSSVFAAGLAGRSTAKVDIQEPALANENGQKTSAPAQPMSLSATGTRVSQSTRLSAAAAASSRPPEPLGDERYLIRFTAGRELHAQIQQLKSLMRHQIPDGDVGKILAKSVAVLLEQVRGRKFGELSAPRSVRSGQIRRSESAQRVEPAGRVESAQRVEPAGRVESAQRVEPAGRVESVERFESVARARRAATLSPSRHIPTAIRRAVAKRDSERCTFMSETGRRCGSRDFLEFHHCEPWAQQRSHSIDGITLRCRAHNRYEAERDFGVKHMQQFRRREQSRITELLASPHPELDLNPVRDPNRQR